MSTSKHIDHICIAGLAIVLIITVLFVNAGSFGVQAVSTAARYETRLFNTSMVHTIDIVMDDWDTFLKDCINEEYINCAVVIDGESYKNVAIRAKGNTSLSQVASYGNDRYKFRLLRAESVSGQLAGTIPATLDAQMQDNSSFIDASNITISPMGSMENAMHNIKGWKN